MNEEILRQINAYSYEIRYNYAENSPDENIYYINSAVSLITSPNVSCDYVGDINYADDVIGSQLAYSNTVKGIFINGGCNLSCDIDSYQLYNNFISNDSSVISNLGYNRDCKSSSFANESTVCSRVIFGVSSFISYVNIPSFYNNTATGYCGAFSVFNNSTLLIHNSLFANNSINESCKQFDYNVFVELDSNSIVYGNNLISKNLNTTVEKSCSLFINNVINGAIIATQYDYKYYTLAGNSYNHFVNGNNIIGATTGRLCGIDNVNTKITVINSTFTDCESYSGDITGANQSNFVVVNILYTSFVNNSTEFYFVSIIKYNSVIYNIGISNALNTNCIDANSFCLQTIFFHKDSKDSINLPHIKIRSYLIPIIKNTIVSPIKLVVYNNGNHYADTYRSFDVYTYLYNGNNDICQIPGLVVIKGVSNIVVRYNEYIQRNFESLLLNLTNKQDSIVIGSYNSLIDDIDNNMSVDSLDYIDDNLFGVIIVDRTNWIDNIDKISYNSSSNSLNIGVMGSKTLLNNCNVIYSEKIKRVFTLDNKTKSTALIAINSGLYNITITSGVRLVDFNYSLMYRYFIVNLAFFGNGSYYTLRNTIEFNILWIETPISINVNQTKHSKNILVKLPYYINKTFAVTSNKQLSQFV